MRKHGIFYTQKNIFFIFLILFIEGCSKHNDPTIPCLLSTVTSYTSYSQNSETITYTYNSNTMLGAVNTSSGATTAFSYGKEGHLVSSGYCTYKYNSDSTLITSFQIPYFGGFGGYEVFSFDYNSEGQLTSASSSGDSIYFEYPSKESKNPTTMFISSTGFHKYVTSTFQYDNAPNPLSATYKSPALFFNFYPFLSSLNDGSYNGYNANVPVLFSLNNIKSVTTTTILSSTYVAVLNIAYTYNAKGYPNKAVQTVSVDGFDQGITRTFDFEYTNCQ